MLPTVDVACEESCRFMQRCWFPQTLPTRQPSRCIRAQNDDHAKHVDGEFCTATIAHLEELSSILGPKEVCFISQDDKCRVSIGVTVANKQSPLLMHVEYRISLPDHDWVVADQHKLIPSIYAGIRIMPDGLGNRDAVSYSGSTYSVGFYLKFVLCPLR